MRNRFRKAEFSSTELKKGFGGRAALSESLAERVSREETLASISGTQIITAYPASDHRAEREISALLGVPMSIRTMRPSKKQSLRELEHGFHEE